MPFDVLLREGVHLVLHLEAGQVVVHHLDGVDVTQRDAGFARGEFRVREGFAVTHPVGVDEEEVVGADARLAHELANHQGHLCSVNGADDADRIVLDHDFILLHQLRDAQELAAYPSRDVQAVAGSREIADFHVSSSQTPLPNMVRIR